MSASQVVHARFEMPETTKRWMPSVVSSRSASDIARQTDAAMGTCSGIVARVCGDCMKRVQLRATLSSSAFGLPSPA